MKSNIFSILVCLLFANQIWGQVPPNGNCLKPFTTGIETQKDSTVAFSPPPTTNPPIYNGPENETDKVVYWVHGLSGNAGAWAKPANVTQALVSGVPDYPSRKVMSFRPTYSEDGDLLEGAEFLQGLGVGLTSFDGLMTPLQREDPRNFIIAHSQGGLVSRKLDQLYASGVVPASDQRFHGIVTFGTPHGGARIGNNTKNGKMIEFADDFCHDLAAGPTSSLLPIGLGFITAEIFCDAFTGSFTGTNKPILGDYAVGAPGIIALNDGVAQTPFRVAFYGVEEEEVLWRELYHLGAIPNFGKASANYPVFGANDDDNAGEITLKLQSNYNSIAILSGIAAVYNLAVGNFISAALFGKKAHDWRRGAKGLQNANETYKQLIGASGIQAVITSSECRCNTSTWEVGDPDHDSWSFSDPVNSDMNQTECNTSPNCFWYNNYAFIDLNEANDGVVLASSQTAFPGVNATAKMDGSNHQSERNDENTKKRLFELFEGNHGLFFKTEKRQ
jgi:pimeloyl-ACP methyl ester carboxylesterase